MFLLSIGWLAWKLFVGAVAVTAVADTGRTWGAPQAIGLAVGLLALWLWVPLGGLFAIGASIGALTMARGEQKRLGLRA
jgi:hypothetical protein